MAYQLGPISITGSAVNVSGSVSVNNNNLRPYRVYTALIAQNGSSSTPSIANDEAIVVGVSYEIVNTDGDTVDFTNVGASSNGLGTRFVATGTTPTSWGTSSLGELGWDPAAIRVNAVLEDTIGRNITFGALGGDGQYAIYSDAAFTANKTYTVVQPWADDNVTPRLAGVFWQNTSELDLYVTNDAAAPATYLGTVNNPATWLTSIELRVYN